MPNLLRSSLLARVCNSLATQFPDLGVQPLTIQCLGLGVQSLTNQTLDLGVQPLATHKFLGMGVRPLTIMCPGTDVQCLGTQCLDLGVQPLAVQFLGLGGHFRSFEIQLLGLGVQPLNHLLSLGGQSFAIQCLRPDSYNPISGPGRPIFTNS